MSVGYAYDPRLLEHDVGGLVPECAERVSLSDAYLRTQDFFEQLVHIPADYAEEQQIQLVHDAGYLLRVKASCAGGSRVLDSEDVIICEKSYDIARLAAGCALALGDAVAAGKVQRAFGLIRPPGHHAEKDRAMGFCIFNNIAILARYMQEVHGIGKIVIVDWDVHHGNGTQHAFEWEDRVVYISLHQFPHYPGTGAASERGQLDGLGTILNIPMAPGASDEEYRTAFAEEVLPRIDQVKPELILISAGFDAHIDDPLGYVNLTTDFYGWMTTQLVDAAKRHCGGRLISLLEGGYHFDLLPLCIAKHVQALL